MAKAAVGWAINKLDTLLTGEARLLRDVHKELQYIKDELETIKSFLRDADAKLCQENEDSQIKTWVKQVRQVAFRIEDVIDEYMFHVAQSQRQNGYLHQITHVVKNLKARHGLASKIQDSKKSITDIKERRERYNFNSSLEQGSSDRHTTWDPRVHSLSIEEAELVGIESPKAELICRLVEGASKNAAISVVGMGGLGKTTLAKKVYDSEKVTAHFDCKAWITVSQSYKPEELLRGMIGQFQGRQMLPSFEGIPDIIDKLRHQMLPAFEGIPYMIDKLRECVSDKRFVVVFDDVWGIEFWENIKNVLPDNGKGNKIIITTRNEGVAPSPNESPCYHVHKLQPLPETKAYELFCKKVFKSNGGNCPSELQELSHTIVEKCEGLPLGIATIGGLLATKDKSIVEWKKFYDGFNSFLASDQRLSNVIKLLSLSYHGLPNYLKSCFLYLSLFPEDYSIDYWRLIRLWIAEGFIKEIQGRTFEEVAEDYLTELIHRSLVQVEDANIMGKQCRVHDLMREVILSRSKELSFDRIPMEKYQTFKGRSRYISINGNVKDVLESSSNDSQTHSIILFEVDDLPKSLVCSFIKNAKFLRSLDFEGAPLDFIPNELGNLWHLRYLSLKDTKVKVLPKSIGKLYNLETLDLRQSYVYDIPIEINRLLKLRCLICHFNNDDEEININFYRGMKMHGDVGCLKSLQVLRYIEVDHAMGLITQLEKLIQLRSLAITKLKRESGKALCSAVEKMTRLHTLSAWSVNEEEFLELQSISDPPPLLQRLHLNGPLVNDVLPHWISKLIGLVEISLSWSRLGDDAIQTLEALPNIQQLWLYKGYNGKQLHFRKGGFQKLKVLHLLNLIRLNAIVIDEEALPVLEELWIGPCPELKEVPSGIQFLRNLKELWFFDIQRKFAIRMQPDGGHEYQIVKYIPLVLFLYNIKGIINERYKLGDLDLLKRLEKVPN